MIWREWASLTAAVMLWPQAHPPPNAAPLISADTVAIRATGDPKPASVGPVQILWQSDELEHPISAGAAERLLVIADRTRLHLVPLDGGAPTTRGREGDGPGEYRSIAAVGIADGDTILVFDSRLRRLSYLAPDGTFVRSTRAGPSAPFVNPSRGGESLVVLPEGILWTATELVRQDRPVEMALMLYAPSKGKNDVLHVWQHVTWKSYGQFLGPSALFDYGAIVAIGLGGQFAHGDGRGYCISWHTYRETSVAKVCREVLRTRVGRGIRSPDPSLVADPFQQEVVRAFAADQEVPRWLPAFDRLLFGEDGRLWVRRVTEDMADAHPEILAARPELGPQQRQWDVMTRDGVITSAFMLPSQFDLRVVRGDRGFGFLTLDTGEVVVGLVAFGG